ncbi:MAG: hypothetical protein ACYC2K_11910 [Gemmatimonadales bacterium]
MGGRDRTSRSESAALTVPAFRDVVIIGGGCYGSFYAAQLTEAALRGKIRFSSVIVVDRNPQCQAVQEGRIAAPIGLAVSEWGAFLDGFLDRPAPSAGQPDDAIVPSPLMPHLMAEWLVRVGHRAAPGRSFEAIPVDQPAGTPYDRIGPGGNRYVSFADWLCPTHCIEPHVCPVIRAPRTWEMADTIVDYTNRLGRDRPMLGPALFITRHRAFGVGMFDLGEVRAARAWMDRAIATDGVVDLVVGTISACHGAVGVVRCGDGLTTASVPAPSAGQ